MTDEDQDFWVTHISTTPEQDQDFGRPVSHDFGRLLVRLILGGLAAVIALSWLVRWLT